MFAVYGDDGNALFARERHHYVAAANKRLFIGESEGFTRPYRGERISESRKAACGYQNDVCLFVRGGGKRRLFAAGKSSARGHFKDLFARLLVCERAEVGLYGVNLLFKQLVRAVRGHRHDFKLIGIGKRDFNRLPAYAARTAYQAYLFHTASAGGALKLLYPALH